MSFGKYLQSFKSVEIVAKGRRKHKMFLNKLCLSMQCPPAPFPEIKPTSCLSTNHTSSRIYDPSGTLWSCLPRGHTAWKRDSTMPSRLPHTCGPVWSVFIVLPCQPSSIWLFTHLSPTPSSRLKIEHSIRFIFPNPEMCLSVWKTFGLNVVYFQRQCLRHCAHTMGFSCNGPFYLFSFSSGDFTFYRVYTDAWKSLKMTDFCSYVFKRLNPAWFFHCIWTQEHLIENKNFIAL